jgi:hypothetical protein
MFGTSQIQQILVLLGALGAVAVKEDLQLAQALR